MLIIIKDNQIHSTYNDDKAGILFSMFPISEIEYISTLAVYGSPLPSRTAEQLTTDNRRMRELAYSALADPLRAEWQYDEAMNRDTAPAKKQLWLDKVAEIKARYPLS